MELTIICVALVVLLAWRERQSLLERRELEQDKRLLMTRIQAPERALIAERPRKPSRPPLPYDDDAAFHAAVARRKEEVNGDS